MSANIPFDIQEEIIKRVSPVKSLVRFRCVSKQWKSLVDSSEFIARHSVNQAHPHHLLLSCYNSSFTTHNCVSILDNDTFPKSSSTLSPIFNQAGLDLLDCSHGLVCLHNYTGRVVVWRTISINICLEKDSFDDNDPVVIDGVIHWVTYSYNSTSERIISFDLTREEFGVVEVSDTLANPRSRLSISKINESLAVLNHHYIVDSASVDEVVDVWRVLKNGSFTKLFTVNVKVGPHRILGFRMNGQPIMHNIRAGLQHYELRVYEPSSEHSNSLGIYGSYFEMTPYTESLLLLNYSKHRCNSYLH